MTFYDESDLAAGGSLTPEGTIAFVLNTQSLFVRHGLGWRSIQVMPYSTCLYFKKNYFRRLIIRGSPGLFSGLLPGRGRAQAVCNERQTVT